MISKIRHTAIALAILLTSIDATAAFARGGHSSAGYHSVRGYTTKRGTDVKAYHATNPNETKRDNWSTKGNVNPFTGKRGTKSP